MHYNYYVREGNHDSEPFDRLKEAKAKALELHRAGGEDIIVACETRFDYEGEKEAPYFFWVIENGKLVKKGTD